MISCRLGSFSFEAAFADSNSVMALLLLSVASCLMASRWSAGALESLSLEFLLLFFLLCHLLGVVRVVLGNDFLEVQIDRHVLSGADFDLSTLKHLIRQLYRQRIGPRAKAVKFVLALGIGFRLGLRSLVAYNRDTQVFPRLAFQVENRSRDSAILCGSPGRQPHGHHRKRQHCECARICPFLHALLSFYALASATRPGAQECFPDHGSCYAKLPQVSG